MPSSSIHAPPYSSTDNISPTSSSSARSLPASHQIYDIDNADDAYELQSIAPDEDTTTHDDTGLPARAEEDASLLPSSRRFSLSSSHSDALYSAKEEKNVLRKLDRRLVLFTALLYCLSFLDRSSRCSFIFIFTRTCITGEGPTKDMASIALSTLYLIKEAS